MTANSSAPATLRIAVLTKQWSVWFGLQQIFESNRRPPIVLLPPQGGRPDTSPTGAPADVFILDLENERDAIGTIEQIRRSHLTAKIVLLSGLGDQRRAREAFDHGADGIILKMQPPAVILAVIESISVLAISQARPERDRAIGLRAFVKEAIDVTRPPALPDTLTNREHEIVRLVEQGLSNKEIAFQLSISDSTVRHHMTSIFGKVGVRNRQQLLIHAHQFRQFSTNQVKKYNRSPSETNMCSHRQTDRLANSA